MKPVVVPIKLVLIVSKRGTFQIASAKVSFGANGINAAVVDLAVGVGGKSSEPVFVNFRRGDAAKLVIQNSYVYSEHPDVRSVLSPNFTLFNGIIDDFVPANFSFGAFTLRVQIISTFAWLASGTLQTSSIISKSYQDTGVTWNTSIGEYPFAGALDPDSTRVDLWDGFRKALLSIATDSGAATGSVTAQIQKLFGVGTNVLAANLLNSITGNLYWNEDRVSSSTIDGIIQIINSMMLRDWHYESFFNRICMLGELFQFSLIENGASIKIVPHTPFFRSSQAYTISASTYSPGQWEITNYKNIEGVVLVSGGNRETSINGNLIAGLYKRGGMSGSTLLFADSVPINGNVVNDREPVGFVDVRTAPVFLVESTSSQFTDPNEQVDAKVQVGTPRKLLGGHSELGDELAKLLCWKMNFEPRTISIGCPFLRSDIGPLTAVKIEFPRIPEIQYAVDSPAVYGSVLRVNITIDATQNIAVTSYDVGHVRSYDQQENEIDNNYSGHPYFSRNYLGGRLDSNKEHE